MSSSAYAIAIRRKKNRYLHIKNVNSDCKKKKNSKTTKLKFSKFLDIFYSSFTIKIIDFKIIN